MVPGTLEVAKVCQAGGTKIAVNIQNDIGALLVNSVLADDDQPGSITSSHPSRRRAALAYNVDAASLPEPSSPTTRVDRACRSPTNRHEPEPTHQRLHGGRDWLKKSSNTAAAFRTRDCEGPVHGGHNPGAVERACGVRRTTKETATMTNAPSSRPSRTGPAPAAADLHAELDAPAALQREPDNRQVRRPRAPPPAGSRTVQRPLARLLPQIALATFPLLLPGDFPWEPAGTIETEEPPVGPG